jgi:hypothetical protein
MNTAYPASTQMASIPQPRGEAAIDPAYLYPWVWHAAMPDPDYPGKRLYAEVVELSPAQSPLTR